MHIVTPPFDSEHMRILAEFSKEEWNLIKSLTQQVVLRRGDLLFEEGHQSDELYFVESGRLEVVKQGYHLATLEPGDWVGEIALLTGEKVRTASVRAIEETVLFLLPLAKIQMATRDDPSLYAKIIATLAKKMAGRLKETSEKTTATMQNELEFARMRIIMGHLIVNLLLMITCFFYVLKIVAVMNIQTKISTAISIPLILLILFFTFRMMKNSHYPASEYGLTLKNWKRAIVESLLWTIPVLLIIFIIRWILIHFVHDYKGHPLFGYKMFHKQHLTEFQWYLLIFGYALFAPIQELVARGCLQGSLDRFLTGRHKTFYAIVLSNLLFSTLHLQVSLSLSISVFFIGCLWGWLYSRHQTLIGVSISHVIVGLWGLVYINVFA